MCLHIDVVTFNRAPHPRPPYPLTFIAIHAGVIMWPCQWSLHVYEEGRRIAKRKHKHHRHSPLERAMGVHSSEGSTVCCLHPRQKCKCTSLTLALNFSTTGEDKGKVREGCKEVSFVRVYYRTHPSHRCLCTICRRFVWVLTGPRVCMSTAPAQSTCSGGRDVVGGEKCQRDRAVNQTCNELSFGLVG